MPRRLMFLVSAAAWVLLGGEGRAADRLHVNERGESLTEAPRNPLNDVSVQPLNDAHPPDPGTLRIRDKSNNTPEAPSGRLSNKRLVEILNTTTPKSNASSFPHKPSGRATNTSLHSPLQLKKARNPLTAVDSTAPPPSTVSSQMKRVQQRKEIPPSVNAKPVNFSASGDFALPNWERAPRLLTTQNNYSRVYRLPSWESSLFLFGVRSNDEVRMSLLPHDKDEAPMNITLYGRNEDSEIHFNLTQAEEVFVSRHSVALTLNTYSWFTIFRKEQFISVHLAGTADPILAYEHPEKNINLLRYTRFQVWSKKKAHWDLTGKAYKNENKGTTPTDEAMKEELSGLQEGLAERFGLVMNLVGVLQRPSIVDNLTLSDIQEIKDIGESIFPLRSILFYYDFILNKNMQWTSV